MWEGAGVGKSDTHIEKQKGRDQAWNLEGLADWDQLV